MVLWYLFLNDMVNFMVDPAEREREDNLTVYYCLIECAYVLHDAAKNNIPDMIMSTISIKLLRYLVY